MSLPDSVNTVYAAGVQVKSVDLNAIQTSIVAHEVAINGNRVIPFGPADMLPAVAAEWEWDFTNAIAMRKRANSNPGADSLLYLDLGKLLRVGDRLVDWKLFVYEANSLTANRTYAKWNRVTMSAFNEVDTAVAYTISDGASAAPASATFIAETGANQTLAQAYHRLQLVIKCKTVATLFSGGYVTIDHP